MKATEIQLKKVVSEAEGDGVVTGYGGALLQKFKNAFSKSGESNMSTVDIMAKKSFTKDFMSQAYSALTSAIQGGIVDPNLRGDTEQDVDDAEPDKETPPENKPATAKKIVGDPKAVAAAQAQKQTSQNINNYVRSLSKTLNSEPDRNKKMALAKELVNFMADRKDYPEWGNALKTAEYVIKQGIQDPNFSNAAINRLRAGKVMEAWQVYWINRLLESIGFSFGDLGLSILKENKLEGKYIIAETQYYKLNTLFESILNENEAISISQFLNRWLPKYMQGVDVNVPKIRTLINQIEDTYSSDKGKKAMEELAAAAYSIDLAGNLGIDNAPSNSAAPVRSGTTSSSTNTRPTSIRNQAANANIPDNPGDITNLVKNALIKLQKVNDSEYKKLIKDIDTAAKTPSTPA